MEQADSLEPKAIRAVISDAIRAMDAAKNPLAVTEITANGGFVTETTLAVVEDGKIIQLDIQ
jgi:branched-chain amino acid transport system substrate-binding protein